MDGLWILIENKARAIAAYCDFMEKAEIRRSYTPPKENEMTPVVETIQHIIDDERDHLNALLTLYDSMTKSKPATDMTEFAQQALADYRERNKLIK